METLASLILLVVCFPRGWLVSRFLCGIQTHSVLDIVYGESFPDATALRRFKRCRHVPGGRRPGLLRGAEGSKMEASAYTRAKFIKRPLTARPDRVKIFPFLQ